MDFSKRYKTFQIHAFWSKEVTTLVKKIVDEHSKSYATQHDIVLEFINNNLFRGNGEFNNEYRIKGKRYFDLKIPVKSSKNSFEIVELKVHTNQLKYLRYELKQQEKIFLNSDYLYFCYFLQRATKQGRKKIYVNTCIYYLVIIKLSKETQNYSINKLVDDIKMGAQDFVSELSEKSKVDTDDEELLGVENMIKVVDLERKLNEKDMQLNDKDMQLNDKDMQLNDKDMQLTKYKTEIARLKEKLKNKRK